MTPSDDEIEAEQVRSVLDRLRRRNQAAKVPTRLPAGLSEAELMEAYSGQPGLVPGYVPGCGVRP